MYSYEQKLAMAIALSITCNDNTELLNILNEINEEHIIINWHDTINEIINNQIKINDVVDSRHHICECFDYEEENNGQEMKGFDDGYHKGYIDCKTDMINSIKSFLKIFAEISNGNN